MEPRERLKTIASTKVGYLRKRLEGQPAAAEPEFVADPGDIGAIIEGWPATLRKAAGHMIERYGPPHEATPTRLIWHGSAPWKRSILFRDEIPHKFPTPHTDFLIQYIEYRVPPERFSDLAVFDGSVIADRTAGELAARCDAEEMNILTLNLAHEIVSGIKSVEEARKVYAENASAWLMNRPAPYTERLLFEVAEGGTADLDESIITGPMARQAAGKMADAVGGREPGRE